MFGFKGHQLNMFIHWMHDTYGQAFNEVICNWIAVRRVDVDVPDIEECKKQFLEHWDTTPRIRMVPPQIYKVTIKPGYTKRDQRNIEKFCKNLAESYHVIKPCYFDIDKNLFVYYIADNTIISLEGLTWRLRLSSRIYYIDNRINVEEVDGSDMTYYRSFYINGDGYHSDTI